MKAYELKALLATLDDSAEVSIVMKGPSEPSPTLQCAPSVSWYRQTGAKL